MSCLFLSLACWAGTGKQPKIDPSGSGCSLCGLRCISGFVGRYPVAIWPVLCTEYNCCCCMNATHFEQTCSCRLIVADIASPLAADSNRGVPCPFAIQRPIFILAVDGPPLLLISDIISLSASCPWRSRPRTASFLPCSVVPPKLECSLDLHLDTSKWANLPGISYLHFHALTE